MPMNRREFLGKITAATAVVGFISAGDIDSGETVGGDLADEIKVDELPQIGGGVKQQFDEVFRWLRKNGWLEWISRETGGNADTADPYDETLFKNITKKFTAKGLDDFGGRRLIEPGLPAMSFIYHALASPRVQPAGITTYPTYKELDALENYIYALYNVNVKEVKDNKRKFCLAVLAYEYRPAYKVPPFRNIDRSKFRKHADFVYSRTGIARIGDKKMNYDARNRCYTNLPGQKNEEKNIAVTPARYGLFLVELVQLKSLAYPTLLLMNRERSDTERYFIRPVTKIVKDSAVADFYFSEYHLNEKLYKLSQFEPEPGKKIRLSGNFNVQSWPFRRINCTTELGARIPNKHNTDINFVELTSMGSSALLSSVPASLVTPAEQDKKPIAFEVPARWKKGHFSNRRYTSYKFIDKNSMDGFDAFMTDGIFRRYRITSRFGTPRNAPMFANIRHTITNGKEVYLHHSSEDFEKKIDDGRYWARLFEDNICDGCIAVNLTSNVSWLRQLEILPAFSIVTAPDFFPYVDGNDINFYFELNNYLPDEHFLEGGTLNLSGIRLKANSDIINPVTNKKAFTVDDDSYNTVTAVISKNISQHAAGNARFNVNFRRDYKNTSFLPDTTSGIFYPGWDATFSNSTDPSERFLATFGLGSPFPEDMKLCAAANGMWPVASPDAGRTFQGSLSRIPGFNRKPSSSIPLMDDELGFHPKSPHVANGKKPSFGWDGEHGPYLTYDDNKILSVNFTDIGRADYVHNILDPATGFDMSKLRNLESAELIQRMECLRKCVRAVDKRIIGAQKVEFTRLWLVSAEKVNEWSKGASASGIPSNLVGRNNNWAKSDKNLTGAGYLFVFATTSERELEDELEHEASKRRNQWCKTIAVCKVTVDKIVWCRLSGSFPKQPSSIKWQIA